MSNLSQSIKKNSEILEETLKIKEEISQQNSRFDQHSHKDNAPCDIPIKSIYDKLESNELSESKVEELPNY